MFNWGAALDDANDEEDFFDANFFINVSMGQKEGKKGAAGKQAKLPSERVWADVLE
eukprot:CAMPEP_0176058924 /NCGR_PEP_ID=MMETSP0120_2-20121206/29364_1 /TAXON_ID=160619 /ORGANISM="Kryptoperidinium foliaceum, Strain CCMP 1326" /LENGTH=55 /DNA_ID=CAMNT_0017392461 /DNA_START=339 /DNA_END=503 /DNA_ORIENTATION=+